MSEALLRNANSLLGLGRQREALDLYERYLKTTPQSAEAWHNRGTALAQMKRYAEALSCYDSALALCPGSAQTWNARGNLLFEERRYDEAPASYEKALELDPAVPYARGYRLLAKLWCCDWQGLEEEQEKIALGLKDGRRVIQPFGSLMLSREPAELAEAARIWMAGRHGAPPPLWRDESYRHDRIRIAYLSGDFREHPVSYLMAGVFEHHDRDRFETMAISFGSDDKSEIRGRIAGAFEHFVDARGMNDFAIASLLRRHEVDIAIDLMGLTADCRGAILAHRPAPIQVNYLGFPGTMASAHMDYLIADEIAIPPEEHRHYSEKIVYLPGSYMANDSARPITVERPSRAAAGLPDHGFVFCSFNSAYKFRPSTFAIWMRLLSAVDGSVLWLPGANASVRANLIREARTRGVAAERIVFARHLESQADHLARISLADLFLDTLPCNAHTTAYDALWAGVPVLTCTGSTFPGRVAASLLHAMGLPELVTQSAADYEALALKLAREPQMLRTIRAKLAHNRNNCALFDTARFTRYLETAFTEMVERRSRRQPLTSFAVERGL
jgi:predicted O-linked N-acetylglucosamine transferase (SPINDLY family)